jgi:hypothetical protein
VWGCKLRKLLVSIWRECRSTKKPIASAQFTRSCQALCGEGQIRRCEGVLLLTGVGATGVEGTKDRGRDGSFTRGCGYPRVPNPTGTGAGGKFRPRVRIRVANLAREQGTSGKFRPRVCPCLDRYTSGPSNIRPNPTTKNLITYPTSLPRLRMTAWVRDSSRCPSPQLSHSLASLFVSRPHRNTEAQTQRPKDGALRVGAATSPRPSRSAPHPSRLQLQTSTAHRPSRLQLGGVLIRWSSAASLIRWTSVASLIWWSSTATSQIADHRLGGYSCRQSTTHLPRPSPGRPSTFTLQATAIFAGTGKPNTRGYPSGAGASTVFYPRAYLRAGKSRQCGYAGGRVNDLPDPLPSLDRGAQVG